MEEKAKARKDQAQRAKELRELQLQSMLMTVATTNGASNSKRGRNKAMDEIDGEDMAMAGSFPAKQEELQEELQSELQEELQENKKNVP